MVRQDSGMPVLFIGDRARWVQMAGPVHALPNALWMPEWPDEDAPAVSVLYQLHVHVFGDRKLPVYVSHRVPRAAVFRETLRALFKPEAFTAWQAAEPAPKEVDRATP